MAARLYFFDRDRLNPGETALTEVRFADPMVGVFDDRCVVRAYSPLRTVAGGVLVHPLDCRLRRKDADFAARFALLDALPETADRGGEALAAAQLALAGSRGARLAELAVLTGLEVRRLEKQLLSLSGKGQAFCFDKEGKAWIGATALAALVTGCLAHAAAFHAKEPLKAGMARGVLLSGWGRNLAPRLAYFVVERCLRAGSLVAEGDVLRLPEHKVELASDQAGLRDKILEAHARGGLTPPNLKDVLAALGVDAKQAAPVLKLLVEEKALVKVRDGLYYATPVVEEVKTRVRAWFETHDDLDPAGLKELLDGISRKFLIALLEYMDRERITVRVGDKRQWRGR